MNFVVCGPSGLRAVVEGREREIARDHIVAFAISPDGKLAALSLEVEGAGVVAILDLRTGLQTPLLIDEAASFGRPAWHPRGAMVTVSLTSPDGESRLLNVTTQGEIHDLNVVDGRHAIAEPDWSASGRWLAFEAQPIDHLRGMTVFLYDAEHKSTIIIDPLEEPIPKAVCPRFAATEWLAYTHTPGGVLESTVSVYRPRGKERRQLGGIGINDPRWAPDHDTLLAARHHGICGTELVVLDSAGGEPVAIETEAGHHTPVFLSRRLAAYIQRPCADSDEIPIQPGVLMEVDLETGRRHRVAEEVMLAEPMLQPA